MEGLGPCLAAEIGKAKITDPFGNVRDYSIPDHHCHVGVHASCYWKSGFACEISSLQMLAGEKEKKEERITLGSADPILAK